METRAEILRNNRTLTELIIGIFIFDIFCQICFLLSGLFTDKVTGRLLHYSAGLWLGMILAVCAGVHMNLSISRALNFDPGTAQKIVRKDSLLRYGVILIIFGLLMVTDVISPLSAFLGLMGLKAGAYLNGAAKKILNRFIGEEELKPLLTPEEQDELYGKKNKDELSEGVKETPDENK